LLVALLALGGSVSPVMAQYYQPSENKKEIVLDKQIELVDNYVDNIAASQKVFVDREVVNFRILITNSGNERLENLSVIDYLPSELELIFYPGTYNQSDNSIRWIIDGLNEGESKEYFIRARITDINYNYEVKKSNYAEVKNEVVFDSDRAAYFVMGKRMPVTGANPLVIGTVFGILSLSSGMVLRKKARGY